MLLKRTMKYLFCISSFLMLIVPMAILNNAPSYGENLALNKPTRQKATFVTGQSEAAVDGNFLTEQNIVSEQKRRSWWSVDLEAVYNVSFIRLSLHNVHSGMRLRIYDEDKPITDINVYRYQQFLERKKIEQPFDKPLFTKDDIKKEYNVDVRLTETRQLRHLVLISNSKIKMGEFEAYSHFTQEVNFALNKNALVFLQNSPANTTTSATFLVDGKRLPGAYSYPNLRWWKIDLRSVYLIGFIVIRFRQSQTGLYLQVSSASNPSNPKKPASHPWQEVYDYDLYNYRQVVREFFPPKQLRHIAQIEYGNPRVFEVEAYAGYNLAYGKLTMQSNTVGLNGPELAVNAVMDDNTETEGTGKKWWSVDLAGEYMIEKVQVVPPTSISSIAHWKLRTSSKAEPGSLSAGYDGWSNGEDFAISSRRNIGVKNYDEAFEARHLAVVSNHSNQSVSIVQFVVYEYNYAKDGDVNISSRVDGYPLSNAVDRDFITHVRGGKAQSNWFTVILTKKIGFRAAILYQNFRQKTVDMITLTIKAVTLFTHKAIPSNTHFNDPLSGWSKCFHKTGFAESVRMECEFNWRYPVTKSIGIDLEHVFGGVSHYIIREIIIYGHELPQFKDGASISVSSPTSSSIQIDFERWNSTDPGSMPPTKYKIAVSPSEIVYYILHKTVRGKSTMSSTVTDLTPDKEYTITLTCQVSGETCPGLSLTSHHSTPCGYPRVSLANITRYKFAGKFGVVVHALEIASECKRIVSYKVIVSSAGSTIYSKEFVQPTDVNITGLTEGDNYTVSIEAENNANLIKKTFKKFEAVLPGPLGFCPPAPKIKTAELTRKHIRNKVVWKQKVRYVCKKNFKRKKGDYVLTCVTLSENTLSWQGEPLECEPMGKYEGSEVELAAYIMVGVAVIGIASTAGALLIRKKRKNSKKHDYKTVVEPAPLGNMEQRKGRMSMNMEKRNSYPPGYESIHQYDQSIFQLAKQMPGQSNADVRKKKTKVPEEPYKSLKRRRSISRK